ncbi:hypothetical protein KP05_14500 [Cobetia amphilecti]|nr:hypothetical protein KP05_14500 [Cobetia amphilecti]
MNSKGGIPAIASLEKIQPAAAMMVTKRRSRSALRGEREGVVSEERLMGRAGILYSLLRK